MKAFFRFNVAIAAFVMTVGIILSWRHGNWTIFARTGSLWVAQAVLAFIGAPPGLLHMAEFLEEQVDKGMPISMNPLPYTLHIFSRPTDHIGIIGLLEQENVREAVTVGGPRRAEELAGRMRWYAYKLRKLELGLVFFGTIVWGFGDLVG